MRLLKIYCSLPLFLFFLVITPLNSQNIAINEIMASNLNTISDQEGDFEDWIELYNYGTTSVNLEGFGLSDDYDDPFKWIFPSRSIAPGEFLLVWASGKDRRHDGLFRNGILREVYTGIPGNSIDDLTDHPDYPDNPALKHILTDGLEAPANVDDYYGQRLHGYIEAPETGNYLFWIAGDDSGLLYLSTNEDSENIVEIASVPGWTNQREWTKYSQQRSAPVSLEAGRRYYIKALMKAHGGSDHLAVRWQLPSGAIEEPIPHNRLLVTNELHTSFSISSEGEEVLLTNAQSVRVDEIEPVEIPRGYSYGRSPDGTGDWYFFTEPTPGSANITNRHEGILGRVNFSRKPGFYSGSISLSLSHPDPEAIIYYTLNGSLPDEGSTQYTSALQLADRSDEENQLSLIPTNFITGYREWKEPDDKVAKITIIRAVAIKQGASSPVRSASYLVFPEGEDRYSLDVVSLITEFDNFFSDETGIYVPGDNYVEGNPSTGNYFQRGREWEREVSMEFFGSDFDFQQDIGARIHGGWTRRDPIKSLRLYARSDYGESRFNYRIFPDLPYESYNRLLLRQSGNDWAETMLRDAMAQHLVSHLDMDTQAYRPTVVFINGEFWGIKNLRERYDRHYLERVYGIDPDNIDYLSNNAEVKEGDDIHYNQMNEFVESNDLSDDAVFSQVEQMMDINNFLDYYSAQIYFGNRDWLTNNVDYWRLRVDYNPYALKGHDGRWRWLIYDVDRAFAYGWVELDINMIEFVTEQKEPGREWGNLLIRNLLDNENFRYSFINRIADHLNTAFIIPRVHAAIDSFSTRIEPQIAEHISRWRYPEVDVWYSRHIPRLKSFATARPAYLRQHVMDHFGIESQVEVTVSAGSTEHGAIRINSVDIDPSTPGVEADPFPWTGIYFQGIPLQIEAVSREGYSFSHWSGTGISQENRHDRVLSITPQGDITLEAHFDYTGLPGLITWWFFGTDLPNNTPLEEIPPARSVVENAMLTYQSALEGYPFDSEHENWRLASLERRNAPTGINYYPEANNNIPFGESDMRGIQVKQPLAANGNQNTIIFRAPTTGYENIVFRFAAMDEGAARNLLIDYAVNQGEPQWTDQGLGNGVMGLAETYQLFEVDLSEAEEASNNPYLRIRIRFEAQDMTASDDNRVTFNNFSLHGVPLDEIAFYNRAGENLSQLTAWGTETDGSGDSPGSFEIHGAKFHIVNGQSHVLNSPWAVTGTESRVVLGDGTAALTLTVNADFDAVIDIMENSTLELLAQGVPRPGNLRDGTTVSFGGLATTVPYASYYNLVLDDIDPVFNENGTVLIRKDLTLTGNVQMPDSRDSHEYDLYFSGSNDQLVSGNGNIVRGYNITFDKSAGTVSFPGENGGTTLSSDNQLRLSMAEGSLFEDSGITIYAGNSVNIAGGTASYNFTGTLVLAGHEEGTVKGAGAGNNFNIRDSNQNNTNMQARLNNLVVRADNHEGEFRFRDGTSNLFVIKGDFVVEPEAAGRLRFYENQVQAGGDFIISHGFAGTIDPIYHLVMEGTETRIVEAGELPADNFTLDNPAGMELRGEILVSNSLNFSNGIIRTAEESMLKLGTEAAVTGHDAQRYVDGPVGIYLDNTQTRQVLFPVGTGDLYRPVGLEAAHENDNLVLYIASLFDDAPPDLVLPGGLVQVIQNYHHTLEITGDHNISSAIVTMTYDPDDIPFQIDNLGIAKSEGNSWVSLGGVIEDGMINSTESFTSPGVFVLAERTPEVSATDPPVQEPAIRIYPNPVRDVLWISLEEDPGENVTVSLLSTDGKIVAEKILYRERELTGSMSLQDLEPGIYIIRLTYGQKQITRTIIVL